jgi:hypothetical protein
MDISLKSLVKFIHKKANLSKRDYLRPSNKQVIRRLIRKSSFEHDS